MNDNEVGSVYSELRIQPWTYIFANKAMAVGFLVGTIIKRATGYMVTGDENELRKIVDEITYYLEFRPEDYITDKPQQPSTRNA